MFTHAIVREPGKNFTNGLTSVVGETPDYEEALEQHARYCQALERCGLQVTRLEADLQHPDSTFVEDTAVLTPACAILTRPGARSREGEVAGIRKPLEQFFHTIHQIAAPGTLDGGDVCEAEKHFFIGVSRRTNEEGARQLARLLAQQGCTSSFVDIRKMNSVLHLKSGIAYVGDGNLVVMEELTGQEQFRDYNLIPVAPGESYAANCLRVNDCVLIPAGYPGLATSLKRRGCRLLPLEMAEFRKMDGGLSCLSLRF